LTISTPSPDPNGDEGNIIVYSTSPKLFECALTQSNFESFLVPNGPSVPAGPISNTRSQHAFPNAFDHSNDFIGSVFFNLEITSS